MGNLIIVKNADFHLYPVNNVEPGPGPQPPTPTGDTYVWGWTHFTDLEWHGSGTSASHTVTGGYTLYDQSAIRGKYINGFKFLCKLAGTITINIIDKKLESGSTFTADQSTTIATVNATLGINIVEFDPILLGENQTIVLGKKNESGEGAFVTRTVNGGTLTHVDSSTSVRLAETVSEVIDVRYKTN